MLELNIYGIKMKKYPKKSLKELWKPIDEEIRNKNIHFTREEAVADDFFEDYDFQIIID